MLDINNNYHYIYQTFKSAFMQGIFWNGISWNGASFNSVFCSGLLTKKISSALIAVFLHGALLIGAIAGSQNNAEVSSQMPVNLVRVNFVSPAVNASTNSANVKILEENGKMKAQNEGGKRKETSGIENENALETSSAVTDAVFDADYLNNPAPVYPSSARKAGVEGKVFLLVNVLPNGKAGSLEISQTSGHSVLDGAALLAVKNWNFVPAKKLGRAVQSQVIVPIEFKLS